MNRDEIIKILKDKLELNVALHSIALEICMGAIYDYLKINGKLKENDPSKESWLKAGLLHDIDYGGKYKEDHCYKTQEALDEYGLSVSPEEMRIIKAHAPMRTNILPENNAEWAIYCADSLTGLIVAVTLVYPSKKLAEVKLSSVLKRFHKDPKFASGTRREEVKKCENPEGLNIPIDTFIEICFEAMKNNAQEIEL
ncbi:MAG TPA: hypothetical protein PK957_03375 [Candidatus Dojkabacteria bacterium]|nr:hypothetical protein [Candidatus Dojkabacteria bacterium]